MHNCFVSEAKRYARKFATSSFLDSLVRRAFRGYIVWHGCVFNIGSLPLTIRTGPVFLHMYERADARLVRRHFRNLDAIIDFGASVGLVGALAVRSSGSRYYHGIEADPQLADACRAVCHDNLPSGVDVIITNAALGSYCGEARFRPGDSNLTGRLVSTGRAAATDIVVPVISARSVFSAFPGDLRIGVVCDVEGAEGVLFGGSDLDWSQVDAIVIELHNCQVRRKAFAVLGDNGFRLLGEGRQTAIWMRTPHGQGS